MAKKPFLAGVILLLCIAVWTGCSQANVEGMILKAEKEGSFYFSDGMTPSEYEELKDKGINELIDENISLLHLTYAGDNTFQEGDHVEVWLDGDILASYPGQATAKKIEIKDE